MRKRIIILTGIFLCALFFFPASIYASENKEQIVRVGYIHMDGFNEQDETGKRTGYGYEYLQRMRLYTDFKYEYIGYDKDWSELTKMLRDGEIDILYPGVNKAAVYQDFLITKRAIGTASVTLSVKEDNVKQIPGEYATYQGMTIGVTRGSGQEVCLRQFAKEKKFTYQTKVYRTVADEAKALQAGEVDAIAAPSLRRTSGEKILEKMDMHQIHILVNKSKKSICDKIDYALEQMELNHMGMATTLYAKYFSAKNNSQIAFTKEEYEFIRECKAKNKVFTAIITPEREPYSYFKKKKATGINSDIVNQIIKRSGLSVRIMYLKDRNAYTKAVKAHSADIVLDMSSEYNYVEDTGYAATEKYIDGSIARVTRKNLEGEPKKIASVMNTDVADNYIQSISEGRQVVKYQTITECINAVLNGDCDAAYIYAMTAQRVVLYNKTNRLTYTIMPNKKTEFCIGVDNNQVMLSSILNKCVVSMSEDDITSIADKYTEVQKPKTTYISLVYDNPFIMVIMALIILILLSGVLVIIYLQRKRKLEHQNMYEIERFSNYVCSANDEVLEFELSKSIRTKYYYEKGKLHVETMPWDSEAAWGCIAPSDMERVKKMWSFDVLEKLIQNGGSQYVECRILDEAGEARWNACTVKGMKVDEEHPMNVMVFRKDIHDTKKDEQKRQEALKEAFWAAERANKAKGMFTSRVSHEIRTPLNAIIGYNTLARDRDDISDGVYNYLVKTDMAARHLLSIINDVLDMSSIDSGKMKISAAPFDIREFVSSISSIYYTQASEKNIDYEAILYHVTCEKLIGDKLRLNQIVMNLMSNAIKFTQQGGQIRFLITQKRVQGTTAHFCIEVEDNGIGMKKEFLERIFIPYEQEEASIAERFGGTGLGMAITKNLVALMNGSMSVKSEEGKGSRFTVNLPFQIDGEGVVEEKKPEYYSNLHMLVVDDQKDTADYIVTILERFGVQCDVAYDGKTAVDKVANLTRQGSQYDMCLMDWKMPGEMSGLDAIREIKQIAKEELPIIIVTAYDFSEIEREAKQLGVAQILTKPVFASVLSDILVTNFGKYKPVENEQKKKYNLNGIHILLAEDNEMNREIARELLVTKGAIVVETDDGDKVVQAFEQSKENEFDVILMDIHMPRMGGYEALRAIRGSQREDAAEIPIIAMTANAFAEDINEALANGMCDHIAKPIDVDHLYATVLKWYKNDK